MTGMHGRGGGRAAGGKRTGPTIYDFHSRGKRRSAREIPRLAAAGVGICWRAGRRELITLGVLELLSGVGVAAEVVVGQQVLQAFLLTGGAAGSGGSSGSGGGWNSVWPSAVLLGVITAVLGVVAAVQREQQRLLAELTSHYAQGRILDVTCAVELAAFDEPDFHDQVARAQAGTMHAPQMVFGLQGLGRSVTGTIGAAAALLAVAPLLVPLALVAMVPGWLASSRRGRAFYVFGAINTPRDRERSYLASLLTGRGPAKEVRAYGLADFLRIRHDRLADDRIAELRRVSSGQLRGAAIADLVSAATIAAAIATIMWLAFSGRLALSAAGAGAGALMLVGAPAVVRRAERRDAPGISDVRRRLPRVHRGFADVGWLGRAGRGSG
jgi:hypothetical protein